MTDRALLEEALEILEEWYDGEEPRRKTQKFIARLTVRFTKRNRWRKDFDAKYDQAKKLVEKGVSVTCACEAIGITRDTYYRRKRIEETGRDRT